MSSVIVFFLSQLFPYLIDYGDNISYPVGYYVTVRLITLIFIVISNILLIKSVRSAMLIGILGVIFIGILFYGIDIAPVLMGQAAFGSGFYMGFISWCGFIWVIILLYKYEKERIKSIIAVSHLQEIQEKTSLVEEETFEEERVRKEIIDKKSGVIGFFSYSMKDSKLFDIKKIAESLTKYKKIDDILYCEEDTRDNFIKYMDENIGKCDVVILFCSPNALNSEFVKDEWMAAHAMKKPIIPVFLNIEHVPPLLRARIGVQFDVFNLKNNIKEIYKIIEKKLHS